MAKCALCDSVSMGADSIWLCSLLLLKIDCSSGSFKTRGLVNQLAHLPPSVLQDKKGLVAMSAGNYGKAFAFAAQQLGLPATVVMPDIAPISRVKIIEVCIGHLITFHVKLMHHLIFFLFCKRYILR